MSVTKNVFKINDVYDLVLAGCIGPYDDSNDPGTLWVWGSNCSGRLGDGTTTDKSSPVQVPGGQWVKISATNQSSDSSSHAIKSDGTLWSWGFNGGGRLGDNTTTHRSSPVQIPGTQWIGVSGGINHVFATKTDGTLWVWGNNNSYGALGIGNTFQTPSAPIQVPGIQWVKASAGFQHSLALKSDGTLWSWGRGDFGELGNNLSGAYSRVSSPIQVPGIQWTDISALYRRSFATKTDGTLWAWGTAGSENYRLTTFGADRSSPSQIPGTQWNLLSSGEGQSCHILAKKIDGTLWAWGGNSLGQLGDNTNIAKNSPTQVPGTNWQEFSHGFRHTVATKTDGTLWSWGCNYSGELGISQGGAYSRRSSPVQIPGNQWNSVATGKATTLAKKLT
jgi:alpha-tubulin suppressor-like RCC1 family protein